MHSEAVELARCLIEIDSVNPGISSGAAGESAAAAFCAEWLADKGFEVQTIGRDPSRPTVIATARGRGDGRSLLLNGHLDTVGVATYSGDPFRAEVRDGKLYGRGAFDMKGSIGALLVGAARAKDAGLNGDLIVTLVADEEWGSIGTEDALAVVTADAAIVAEPSGMELTLAHRGFAWFTLEITGRAAHGSMPEQGIDAIAHAGRVLRALDELAEKIATGPQHPLVGRGTVRVSTIRGGVDAATVAPSCTLTIERRFLPDESVESVELELRKSLTELLGTHVSGATATLTTIVARGGFESLPNAPIAATVAGAVETVTGLPVVIRGEPFWTDAGLFAEAGIPCVVIGVEGGGAHADEEWATVASIDQLTQVIAQSAIDFCGIG